MFSYKYLDLMIIHFLSTIILFFQSSLHTRLNYKKALFFPIIPHRRVLNPLPLIFCSILLLLLVSVRGIHCSSFFLSLGLMENNECLVR